MIPFGEDENKHNKIHVTNKRGGTMVIFFSMSDSRIVNTKDGF